MPGHGLTGLIDAIFVDAKGKWSIDFPVGSERAMGLGDRQKVKGIGMAPVYLRDTYEGEAF